MEVLFLFLKPFESIDQQIKLLHQRGLKITDYDYTKMYLLTNNYYNIINGYSHYFYQSPNKYNPETTFEEIAHAYLFDREIKYTFLKAIFDAEKHIASIFAYTFSEAYPSKPDFYLDPNSYQPHKQLKGQLPFTLKQIERLLKKHQKKKTNTPIKHYLNQYKIVPFWVLINFLTFGEVVTLIKLSPISIQNKVAKRFYSFISQQMTIKTKMNPSIFVSFIENIAEVRNICAHDNRLWNFRCRSNIKYYPDLHDRYNIPNTVSKSDVYNVYIALQCFITPYKYDILTKTLRKRFKNFENKLHSQSINTFLNSLGFPDDWHKK